MFQAVTAFPDPGGPTETFFPAEIGYRFDAVALDCHQMDDVGIESGENRDRKRLGEFPLPRDGVGESVALGKTDFAFPAGDLDEIGDGARGHFGFDVDPAELLRPDRSETPSERIVDAARITGSDGEGRSGSVLRNGKKYEGGAGSQQRDQQLSHPTPSARDGSGSGWTSASPSRYLREETVEWKPMVQCSGCC